MTPLAMNPRETTPYSLLLFLLVLLFSVSLSTASSLERPRSPSLLPRRTAAFPSEGTLIDRRSLVIPPITNPTASSVWYTSSIQTVTWDISGFPPYEQITNKVGKIFLGHDSDDGSLNLDIDNPIAHSFNITDGRVEVLVPSYLTEGYNYLIVLMGVSSNRSPSFTIRTYSDTPPSAPGESSSDSPPSTKTTQTPTATTPIATTSRDTSPTLTAPRPPTSSSNPATEPDPTTELSAVAGTQSRSNAVTAFPTFGDPVAIESGLIATESAPPEQTIVNTARGRVIGCWVVILGVLIVSSLLW